MVNISNKKSNIKNQKNNLSNNFKDTGTQYHQEHADDIPDYGNNSIDRNVVDEES